MSYIHILPPTKQVVSHFIEVFKFESHFTDLKIHIKFEKSLDNNSSQTTKIKVNLCIPFLIGEFFKRFS